MATTRYHELLQERADVTAAGEAVFKAAEAEGRGLTPDEQAADDTREQRLQAIRAEIAVEERRRARQLEVGATVNDAPRVSGGHNRASDRPWGSFGEMLQAVATAERTQNHQVDPRLFLAALGANETVPSDGGYLVQQETSATLWNRTTETGILFPRAMRIPLSSNSNGMKINGIDETSRVEGSQWGGIRVYRTAEATAVTASRPKFRQIALSLKKLMGLCYATDELLEDTAALEAVVMQAFPNAFGWKIDNEFVRGNGAGQMLGVLNSPALVSVAKETGQAGATFVYENAVKMFARLWAPSVPRATWYINQSVYPQLLQMTLAAGTGGVPVFLPPGGASDAPFGSLLGRPIQPIEQASALGTQGDVILMDPTQYVMIEKGGISTASSIHVAFLTDETTYRFTMRNDGEPMWSSPLTPSNGNDTVSPFVTLDTRA